MSSVEHSADSTPTPAERYDAVAAESARVVIRRYSTSFGLACRLLDEPVRTHVRNVYALVRVAGEIVDAPRAGASDAERAAMLDELETDTLTAMVRGHSANLVVHAFSQTARECSIEAELVTPFFALMLSDLEHRQHDRASLTAYIYGSAEVVGLMCLRAFVHELSDPLAAYDALAPGARRLGAAFQKLNFLRDLAGDHRELGRCYLPGIDPDRLTVEERDALVEDIRADLREAEAAIVQLPASSRGAVRLAHALFEELSRRIRETPVERIRRERIRVPAPAKARLVARQVLRSRA